MGKIESGKSKVLIPAMIPRNDSPMPTSTNPWYRHDGTASAGTGSEPIKRHRGIVRTLAYFLLGQRSPKSKSSELDNDRQVEVVT